MTWLTRSRNYRTFPGGRASFFTDDQFEVQDSLINSDKCPPRVMVSLFKVKASQEFTSYRSRLGYSSMSTMTVPTDISSWILSQAHRNGSRRNMSMIAEANMKHPVVTASCSPILNPISPTQVIPHITDNGTSLNDYSSISKAMEEYLRFNKNSTFFHDGVSLWNNSPEADSHSRIALFVNYGYNVVKGESTKDRNGRECFPSGVMEFSWGHALANDTKSIYQDCLYARICTVSGWWLNSLHTTSSSTLTSTTLLPDWPGEQKIQPRKEFSIEMFSFATHDNKDGAAGYNLTSSSIAWMMLNDPNPRATEYLARRITLAASETGYDAEYGSYNSSLSNSGILITMKESGYGYGQREMSVYLSTGVLMVYCVATLVYLLYIGSTGRSSTAWNTAIEMIVLALQSKRPDYLGFTSGGISAISTLEESVGIRVNEQDEAELVFANDRDVGDRKLRKVNANEAY